MAKLTLSTVTNLLGNPNSAATNINNNSDAVEAAIENTLSRDGTSPNQMNADIDMNENDLLNVGRVDAEELYIQGVEFSAALLNSKANVNSPHFTGIPTAPTPAVDTNTTQLATAEFVINQASSAQPVVDGAGAIGTSTRFARADHAHPAPDTIGRGEITGTPSTISPPTGPAGVAAVYADLVAHEANVTDPHGLGEALTDYPLSKPSISTMSWVHGKSVLDFATSATQRSGLLAGSVGLDAVWSDVVSAASAGMKDIVIPRGTFEITDNVVLQNTGFTIRGMGDSSVVRKNGTGSAFRTAVYSAPTITGGRLASDASEGSMSVTLQTGLGSGFSVGQAVIILDEQYEVGSAGPKRAEFACIQAISGDTVTFWGPLGQSYAAASYARLVAAPLTTNVEYSDFTILGDPTVLTADATENFPALLSIQWANAPRVSGMRFKTAGTSQILLFGTTDAVIDRCSFVDGGSATTGTSDPTSTEGQYGFSYGVCEAGINQGAITSQCHGRRIRHLYTTVSVASAVWNNAGSVYGGPTASKIIGCTAVEAKNAAFDTHACGKNITFDHCHVEKGHFVGFQIRSRRTHLKGCRVEETVGAAVWLRGGEASSTQGDQCSVTDLSVSRSNLGISFDGTDWREYSAILDEGRGNKITDLDTSDCGGGMIYTGRNGVAGGSIYCGLSARDMCKSATTNKDLIVVAGVNANQKIMIEDVRLLDSGTVTNVLTVSSAEATASIYVSGFAAIGHTGSYINNTGAATVYQTRVGESSAQPVSRGHSYHDDLYVYRNGSSSQYFRTYFDSTGNRFYSYNNPASVKPTVLYATTDESGTARTDPSNKLGWIYYANVGGTATKRLTINEDGLGFNTANAIPKPTISGSRAGNAALASLLTNLATYGLITDGTSA